jgi:hypothetical protein
MAAVHHRRVVTVPTPTWYLERRGSHNRNYATCAARNMPYSLAVYLAKSLRRGDSATSFPERFARLRADYSEVSYLQPRIGCCWLAEWNSTALWKKGEIPIRSCWSQPAEDWEGFLSREAPQKLHALHEWVPTMKSCQPLPREQKPV